MITSTAQHSVAKPVCIPTQAANPVDSLPVIKSATCARFGIKTKIIKVMVNGEQVAWQETDASNPRSAVVHASLNAAYIAANALPRFDKDPIMQDMELRAAKSVHAPNWTGD